MPSKRKDNKISSKAKPKQSRIRIGVLSESDLAFFNAYGEGGMKLALGKKVISTEQAGYGKIKRTKAQRKKAQTLINQTNALMQKYPRLRRSFVVVELAKWEGQ